MEENHNLALYVAYYLFRFNDFAYLNLGFKTQKEAYIKNAGILPLISHTLKNIRVDSIHGRKAGLRQIPFRPSCAWETAKLKGSKYFFVTISNLSRVSSDQIINDRAGRLKGKKNIIQTMQINWSWLLPAFRLFPLSINNKN